MGIVRLVFWHRLFTAAFSHSWCYHCQGAEWSAPFQHHSILDSRKAVGWSSESKPKIMVTNQRAPTSFSPSRRSREIRLGLGTMEEVRGWSWVFPSCYLQSDCWTLRVMYPGPATGCQLPGHCHKPFLIYRHSHNSLSLGHKPCLSSLKFWFT